MNFTVSENCLSMIGEMSNAFGPSGFEDAMLPLARKYAGSFADVTDDHLRNIYIRPRNMRRDRPVLMLDAHCDEVGFMVHSIRPCGTLRFVTLGGWSMNTLAASAVLVRNADGEYVPGVIAAKPVHFMTAAERAATGEASVSDFSIDIGAVSAEEARDIFKIRIGEPVVSDVRFRYSPSRDIMIGKGFDCRIGCAALIETMRRLQRQDLPFDVVGVLSAQEEVGERGIRVSVGQVKPAAAICFEGCPADDTFTEPYAVQTALKHGPMLRFMDCSVICNPRFQRFALETAEGGGIPVQSSVREGGGNDGAVTTTALDGIPSIVMGVPVRYIHSHYSMTSYFDFEATVRAAEAAVRALTPERLAAF